MPDRIAHDETEADIAEKVCDGLEIMAAFCAIENIETRRAVKRVVFALSGIAAGSPSTKQWNRFKAYAEDAFDDASRLISFIDENRKV